MDQDTIQKIAAEVAKHLPTISWSALAIQALLIALAAAAGAYFGEYLIERGKNLATRADFDTLKDQLRANTQVVESIKSDVSQRDWAEREWRNLRRVKLEELLECMHECEQFRDLSRRGAIAAAPTESQDPVNRFDTLGPLYFPEGTTAINEYWFAHREYTSLCQQFKLDALAINAHADITGLKRLGDEMISKLAQPQERVFKATSAVRTAARALLVEIMGVSAA
jgi:hypothetical protein